ncbi:MAG: hypothetical protein ACM3KE_14170 [Hyphomicrobiales bacterium]
MTELLVSLGKLSIGFLGILGPVALLLCFLHIRDRRQSTLYPIVLCELNRPDLRGMFAVKIKGRPLGADTVIVELWECSREQVWNVIERLSAKLPAHVRFEVNGITDCRARSTWKLTVMRSRPSASYCTG